MEGETERSGDADQTERRASLDDIRACFRLLLGREPHPEEWKGHASRAGKALSSVVSSYVNCLEFHRRRLQDPTAGARPVIADVNGFRLFAAPDDLAVGTHVLNGSYEPEVATVFRQLLRPGMHVLDVGANIGFFTMLSAQLVGPAGSVMAVEPNPRNARMVEASRRLNGFEHVTVLQAAAGRKAGILGLWTSFTNGTTMPLELGAELEAETVACLPLDRVVDRMRPVSLIKLDVEGAEYEALVGAESTIWRDRPAIVLEFSPPALRSVSNVDGHVLLQWLVQRDYFLNLIHQDGRPVDMRQTVETIMQAFQDRQQDHIDIVAVSASRALLEPGW